MLRTRSGSEELALRTQLKEVGLQLKALQQQFLGIKKRAGESVSTARKRNDTRKLSGIRKQLGLE